jgi:hypothetical protein
MSENILKFTLINLQYTGNYPSGFIQLKRTSPNIIKSNFHILPTFIYGIYLQSKQFHKLSHDMFFIKSVQNILLWVTSKNTVRESDLRISQQ